MGGLVFKIAVGGFLVWLSAQMGTFAEEILGKVRESVQASELVEIDRYVHYQSAFGDDASKKAHAPKDQIEFERVLREWTAASGNRNVTLDRWEQPYVYFKVASPDPREVKYRITSKGADRKIGSADDLVLERDNERTSINRDPTKIAESAIEQKKALDREVAKKVNELLREAPPTAASQPPRASTGELLDILKKA